MSNSISYTALTSKGITHPLQLIVGGLCYLLVKSELSTAIEVAKWAFKGYGLRWKIEEYQRHLKKTYRLEAIQMKTFDGVQSVLAILTVSMHMIHKKMKAKLFGTLLVAAYNYLNKYTVRELTNFIYNKISKVISILLILTKSRWSILKTVPPGNGQQLNLKFI